MQIINSVKHVELIRLIYEFDRLLSNEEKITEKEDLEIHKAILLNLYHDYLRTINSLEEIINDYHKESRIIRQIYISKPFRKLKIKKSKPDKFKEFLIQLNALAK